METRTRELPPPPGRHIGSCKGDKGGGNASPSPCGDEDAGLPPPYVSPSGMRMRERFPCPSHRGSHRGHRLMQWSTKWKMLLTLRELRTLPPTWGA